MFQYLRKPLSYCQTFELFYLPTELKYYKIKNFICPTTIQYVLHFLSFLKIYGKYTRSLELDLQLYFKKNVIARVFQKLFRTAILWNTCEQLLLKYEPNSYSCKQTSA